MDPTTRYSCTQCPAPGKYEQMQMNGQGKYFCSKYKNTPGYHIPDPNLKRFEDQIKVKIPGPGQYNSEVLYNKDGKAYKANIKSITGVKFP